MGTQETGQVTGTKDKGGEIGKQLLRSRLGD